MWWEPAARDVMSAPESFVGRLVDVACNGWGGLWRVGRLRRIANGSLESVNKCCARAGASERNGRRAGGEGRGAPRAEPGVRSEKKCESERATCAGVGLAGPGARTATRAQAMIADADRIELSPDRRVTVCVACLTSCARVASRVSC